MTLKQSDLLNLSPLKLSCLIIRIAKRFLPILAEVDAPKKNKQSIVITSDRALLKSEDRCRNQAHQGHGLTAYSGTKDIFKKISELVQIAQLNSLKHISVNPHICEHKDKVIEIIKILCEIRSAFDSSEFDGNLCNDVDKEISIDLVKLIDLSDEVSLDPSDDGPLGAIWPGPKPKWLSVALDKFKEVLDDIKVEQSEKIKLSKETHNPEKIAEVFEKYFKSFSSARLPNPCLFIKSFINEAYYASMQCEEGRPARIQAIFRDNRESPTISFLKSFPYNKKNLVKLSPIVDLGFRHLHVSADNNNELEILGVTDLRINEEWGNDSFRWNFFQEKRRETNVLDLRVRVLGPGFIQVSDGPIVWELNGDKIREFRSVISIYPMATWLRDLSKTFETCETYFVVNLLRYSLCKIIQKMILAEHGGTILIVKKPLDLLEMKYKVDSKLLRESILYRAELGGVINRRTEQENNCERAHFTERNLARAIDMVASFSNVDGAVVLDWDLNILGFGCEINYEPKKDQQSINSLANICEYTQEDLIVDQIQIMEFGMRHRSAYGYCCEDSEAIAIVVSQDGGVKVFCTNKDKSIVLYKNVIPELNAHGKGI